MSRERDASEGWPELETRLEGHLVVLEPLAAQHEAALWRAAEHAEIWSWLPPLGESQEAFSAWFADSLDERERGREAVFATVDRATGEPVGSTRFFNIRRAHRGVEIGWTWIAPDHWRTGANVEAKLLMMEHAFERVGCVRVEFKTDARNERSRNAIAALPARFEGVFRKHMIIPGVGLRDTAYYSVIEDDWPEVRENLRRRLERARSRAAA